MLERELKLAVPDAYLVPELDDAIPEATLAEPETLEVRDTYFDTPDLKLTRWGCSLRYRNLDGWTVKLAVPADAPLMLRHELHYAGEIDKIPAKVASILAPITRGAALGQIAELRNQRTIYRWFDTTRTLLVELCDDRVHGESSVSGQRNFRELEIEIAANTSLSVVDRLKARLAGAGNIRPRHHSKLCQLLGRTANTTPEINVSTRGKTLKADALIRDAMAESVTELIHWLPHALAATTPEGVHQARINIRRLRADFRAFSPMLQTERTNKLIPILKQLALHLGHIRNADVLEAALTRQLSEHREIAQHHTQALFRRLDEDRHRDRESLKRFIDDLSTLALFDDLVEIAQSAPLRDDAKRAPLTRVKSELAKSWRRLHRAVKSLPQQPSADDLHRVRILSKRVRYISDAVTPAFRKNAKPLSRALKRLQNTLGDINDVDITCQWLAQLASDLQPLEAFAAGELAQQFRLKQVQSGTNWQRDFEKAKRKSAWLR